jgi:hypothetical protein
MATYINVPIPQDEIKESFVWRDWFQRLSNKVYGTLASQDDNAVDISGGDLNGVNVTNTNIDSSPIGATTPDTGDFTTLTLTTALGIAYGGTGAATTLAKYAFIGPTSTSGAPSFRALVAGDIPALSYAPQTSGTAILYGNGSGGFSSVTIGTGVSFVAGTLSATGSGGTVTSVTGTAPVVSSGGTTPDISMDAASTSVNGYLTSTDWNTFNGKQPAGTYVTTVTGTAPVVSSGGTTPAISMAAASSSVNGYLTSTDWSTFNSKQAVAAPVTYTANFSVAVTDIWVINNKTGSSCTATLPAASSYAGRVLRFQNYQSQTLVSATSNVVPMTGGAAGTAILAAVAGDTCVLVSDGSNWITFQYTPNNILLLE